MLLPQTGHGTDSIDFLNLSNFCMCGGRGTSSCAYTSVSSKDPAMFY